MSSGRNQNTGLLSVALLLAMVLQLLPLYGPMVVWRPNFVLLVLFFFLLFRPLAYGIATAWIAGLVLDILYGGLLGSHAFSLGVAAYLIVLLRPRLLQGHLWFQAGVVLLLTAASQLIDVSLNTLISDAGSTGSWSVIWCPAITSAMVWPLVYVLLMRTLKL